MLSIIQLIVGVCTLSGSPLEYFEVQTHQMTCVKAIVQCVEKETPFARASVDDFNRCI